MWTGVIDKAWRTAETFRRRHVVHVPPPGIVSFTFDDAPETAFTIGGEILESANMRGTFYLCGSLLGSDSEVGRIATRSLAEEYARRGHEIGNHSFHHVRLTDRSFFQVRQDIRRNLSALRPLVSSSFAFPFGAYNARTRFAAASSVGCARGIRPGINQGTIDWLELFAKRVYAQDGLKGCLDLLATCLSSGGWLIYYTHDVTAQPSPYGTTPDAFRELVAAVAASGARIATVAEVWPQIQAYCDVPDRSPDIGYA